MTKNVYLHFSLALHILVYEDYGRSNTLLSLLIVNPFHCLMSCFHVPPLLWAEDVVSGVRLKSLRSTDWDVFLRLQVFVFFWPILLPLIAALNCVSLIVSPFALTLYIWTCDLLERKCGNLVWTEVGSDAESLTNGFGPLVKMSLCTFRICVLCFDPSTSGASLSFTVASRTWFRSKLQSWLLTGFPSPCWGNRLFCFFSSSSVL